MINKNTLNWKVAGFAGEGIMTTGLLHRVSIAYTRRTQYLSGSCRAGANSCSKVES